MAEAKDVYIAAATRTAIGAYGGSLKSVALSELATLITRSALERAKVPLDAVGHLAMGNVIPTEPADAYLSRVAAVNAGLSIETPAFNVNRLCGSGLQAIVSAAQSILLGDCEVAVAAGAESMSRGPYTTDVTRWGARMGDVKLVDYTVGVLHDPFHRVHMGITAENVSDKFGITRQMMDELAVESHRRAAAALEAGVFREQITPVLVKARNSTTEFAIDEHVKAATTLETLSAMRPAFRRDGRVTAGNSSGMNDGAAALVLASSSALSTHKLDPIARLVSYAHAGVEPSIMGIGSVPAARLALSRAGLRVEDLDIIEANEAFAAQACAVSRELQLDPARVNPHGSGISLGHPIGATGAIIATKAVHELNRIGGRYAMAVMCIGGGQGIACIFERA
ncbi:beta-ketothiolase BktB [Cupriavidus necator]